MTDEVPAPKRTISSGGLARALVLEAPRRLVERTFEIPQVGHDDALLQVEACGLCGTDHELWTGSMKKNLPIVPGHEAVGRIAAIGDGAAKRWGVQLGDRVGVAPRQACGACSTCTGGDPRGCERHRGDTYGSIHVSTAPSLWGGYGEYQYLSPDSQLVSIPDHLAPDVAAMFNAVANGIRWGAVVPGTKENDVVAVLGPGIRGLSAAVAAKEAGASFVMVTGHGPRDAERLALARRFGIDLTVDVATEDPAAALVAACGRLADVVVDVTAMAPAAFVQALDIAAPRGTVCIAGIHGDGPMPGFAPDIIVLKELHIIGTRGTDLPEFARAVELISSGNYPFDEVPREVAGLGEVGELLALMAGEREGSPPPFAVLVP